MNIPQSELFAVLQEFNPWWADRPIRDLPSWERSAAGAVWDWVESEETKRALLLSGARQTGKTTIFRQTIKKLVAGGFPKERILYATFDHPLFKLSGIEKTLATWNALIAQNVDEPKYLFLDEIQNLPDWQVWLKHQVDFQRQNRVAVTGSAGSIHSESAESGVGRWETILLPTLSFGEFLRLKNAPVPALPRPSTLMDLFEWSEADFLKAGVMGQELIAPFNDYLLRGGFPEPALVKDLERCQRLLREDIVDKVLKRDMTAYFGVRRVLEVERLFLYLCYHDGAIVELASLARQFEGITKSTISHYLDLLESTHLVYRLKPFGYGKEILRGNDKVYLADPALAGAVLLLGRKLLEQPERLGIAVETAVFKHLLTRHYNQTPTFSYWRDHKGSDLEVDLIAEIGDQTIPYEVKYRGMKVTLKKLRGLSDFLEQRKLVRGLVVTQLWDDFGVIEVSPSAKARTKTRPPAKILKIPGPLACFWLSD